MLGFFHPMPMLSLQAALRDPCALRLNNADPILLRSDLVAVARPRPVRRRAHS